jgi:hypothetical protein
MIFWDFSRKHYKSTTWNSPPLWRGRSLHLKIWKQWFSADKIYEARWVWYHSLLAVELAIVIVLLLGIYLSLGKGGS